MLIIEGQAGGNEHGNKGGGTSYLCLPNDPDNGKPYSYANDVLYGAEYSPSDVCYSSICFIKRKNLKRYKCMHIEVGEHKISML
jgi:hypothetical protein